MTTPTTPHDSTTCSCAMCRWAERQQSPATTASDGNVRRVATAVRQDRHYASLTTVRAAIADVLDEGDPDNLGQWTFYKTESDWQSERRGKFMDRIVERILALQHPPHEMDARLRSVLAEDSVEMGRLVKERLQQ